MKLMREQFLNVVVNDKYFLLFWKITVNIEYESIYIVHDYRFFITKYRGVITM